MRDIGSRSVTGPQAVLCAAVCWWLDGFDLEALVLNAVEGIPASELWSRDPAILGSALSPRLPWDRVNQHFWNTASAVPAARRMVEEAVRSWRTRGSRVREAKAFVASVILREAGEIVKRSGFLESASKEIAAARAARRLS